MINISPSAPILVNSRLLQNAPCINYQGMGRAKIIERVIPGLAIVKAPKPIHTLSHVDGYMLIETRQLLDRLTGYFEQCKLDKNAEYELIFEYQQWVIKYHKAPTQDFNKLINQDTWSIGAINWLEPNYQLLIHSIELRQFADIYQQNIKQAVTQYRHFEQPNNGLQCKLSFKADTLNMYWESAVQRFYLPNTL